MINIETISLLQRLTGVIALVLVTLQLFLSSDRKFIKYHMVVGIFAYLFIFLHPLLYVLVRYYSLLGFDPFYVFVDFCVMCRTSYDFFLSFGRYAFYIFTMAVIVAKARNGFSWFSKSLNEFIRMHWRKLHALNYLAFIFVSAHAINLGSDVTKPWFMILFAFCQLVFVYVVVKRLREVYKSSLVNQAS